jgi:predicted nucleic acid-binding protein
VRFVLDASVVLAWQIPDEKAEALAHLIDRLVEVGAVVPGHWRLEVANGLFAAERRKRIDAAFREEALADLALLPITIDPDTAGRAWTDTAALAERHRLTIYDAAYLELARRLQCPLATLDGALQAAAEAEGVPLERLN